MPKASGPGSRASRGATAGVLDVAGVAQKVVGVVDAHGVDVQVAAGSVRIAESEEVGGDDDDADVGLEVYNTLTGWACGEGKVSAERPFACETDLRLLA